MSTVSPTQHRNILGSLANQSNIYNTLSPLSSSHLGKDGSPAKSVVLESTSLLLIKKRKSSILSPFEKIKLESDRKTAHGHPLILPTDYGRFGPVFDVFALYHNAVKRQAIVAYNLLEALNRFKYEVTQAETELFLEWFHIFQDAIVTILTVEEEEVFPFLEQNGVAIPDEVSNVERQKARDLVSEALGSITVNLETIRLLAAGESVTRISSLVNAFLQVVLDYLDAEKVSLPTAIAAAGIPPDNEKELRLRFVQALGGKANAAIYLPFISHWLSRRQLCAWKKASLSRLKALRYEQWKKKFSSTYQEIPVTIMTRLTSSTAPKSTRSGIRASPTAYLGRKNRYNFR